jgi:3-mercaptopyruvate sulfurtransferase SseA
MAVKSREALVTTEEIAARLGESRLRLLEVDEDTEAFGRSHIQGALGVPCGATSWDLRPSRR